MIGARTAGAVYALVLMLIPLHADGQFVFVDVSSEAGIGPYVAANGKGSGVAAADFDDDGDIDLFIPNAETVPDQLYRNLGGGRFEEIAGMAGVASLSRSRAALWFDYDGDHLLDLFVAGDCWNSNPDCPDVSTLRLYRQFEDAQFEDVTQSAGFLDDLIFSATPHRGGIAAGDIDNDGYLDLVFGLWSGEARLFLNRGDGTFSDIGAASGIGGTGDTLSHWQPLFHDFNRDGFADIYYALDFTQNKLWINLGDRTFFDAARSSHSDNAWNDMGLAFGDYDNDGDMDLYVTNISNASRHNELFRNDSGDELLFSRTAVQAGVASGGWGWGTTFLDADNDGDLDLAATNGWFSGSAQDDPSRFYLNNGGNPVTFSDVSDAVGFNDTYWGSSVVALDYDRDGDLDLVQSCNGSGTQPNLLRVLENRATSSKAGANYLTIKPRMDGPNYRAIGAVVRIETGSAQMMRVITAGTSFLGQEPAEAFFGVGEAETIAKVTVEWPDGTVSVREEVAANQVLVISNTALGEGEGEGEGEQAPPVCGSGRLNAEPSGSSDPRFGDSIFAIIVAIVLSRVTQRNKHAEAGRYTIGSAGGH